MDAHPNGAVFLKNLAEFGGDALGKKNGNAGAYADELDVGDRSQFAEEVVEFFVGEKKGVASTEQNVSNFGVLANVLKTGFKFGMKIIILGV